MSNNKQQLAVRQREQLAAADALSAYGATLDQEMMQQIMRFAPWANDSSYPMTTQEFSLTVRRAMAMGLDPFNPHEVQVWKDSKGVQFQIAYTLMVEWVRHFKGEHTQPRYRTLDEEEMLAQGLTKNDHAVECRFLMVDDIPKLTALIEAEYPAAEARAMLEIVGLGTANSGEWSNAYFAPKGRTKLWKLEKRALVDAYRRRFGTPSAEEIRELRRLRGDDTVAPEDWDGTEELATLTERARLAQLQAQGRAHEAEWDGMTPDEQQARAAANSRILYGDPEFEGFGDEPRTIDQEPEPIPEPEPEEPVEEEHPLGPYSNTELQRAIGHLLAGLREVTDHYTNSPHVWQALLKVYGEDFRYPHPRDAEAWTGLKVALVERVEEKERAAKAATDAQPALPMGDEEEEEEEEEGADDAEGD